MKPNLRYFFFLLLSFSVSALAFSSQNELSKDQKKAVESVVKTYFVKHPEALLDAFKALRDYQMAQQQKQAQSKILSHADQLFSSPTSPVVGNPNGNVTLVEFLDYQCGHCKAMEEVVKQRKKQDKNLRVVVKELPIFGGHSLYAAKAALAASKQGQFEAFHTALLTTELSLTQSNVMKLAKKAGLDVKALKKAMKDKAIAQEIQNNIMLARALGIAGTPALVIGRRDGQSSVYIPGEVSASSLDQSIRAVRHPVVSQAKSLMMHSKKG